MAKKINRIGMVNYNKQGLKMTIIDYKRSDNITVQFEDGTIIENKTYSNFTKGMIKHPNNKKKSHEQFIKEFYEKNSHANEIEILGKYEGCDTEINCHCKICDNEWETTPHRLLGNHGCPQCYNNRRGDSTRKTHEQFIAELYKINKNIEVLSKYINSDTHIDCYCKVCGNKWDVRPANLLKGYNCPKCSIREQHDKQRKSHEQYIKEMNIKQPNIKVLGKYIDNHTGVKCQCEICGNVWSPKPNVSLGKKSCGCPQCAINNNRGENSARWKHDKTQEEREQSRGYYEYNQWREKVFEENHHTCECCGQHGGTLNAHHKDGYNWCIERRLDVTNGVVLCEDCHKDFHNIYGYGYNTEEQYEKWINYKDLRDIS